ncbi:hypothetical protein V2G26_014118 [Clonostachys chloroleuca]
MSEVASRPSASRGRGSGRGGRGGFAGRGGRRTNGDKAEAHATQDLASAFDDEGDIGELRRQYGDKTSVIREMFPDWSEVDVLFALQETNGDQNEAVTRIAEGNISQWGEVSKPKKPVRSKVKDTPGASTESTVAPRSSRGGRNATEGGRGRGRATERGGRGGRGRSSQPTTNGPRHTKEGQQLSVPTEESTAFPKDEATIDAAEDKSEPLLEKPAASAPETTKPAAPQAKTWASMLRQSTAPKPAPIPKEIPAPAPPAELPAEPEPTVEPAVPAPEPEPVAAEEESTPVVETISAATAAIPLAAIIEPEVALSPSHDELTKTNLEQNPPSANATPLSAAQQQHQVQRQTSGYATSAIKATAERAVRTPSYQRRVLDQEEAVRLPGNREVDRAAVQFGAFNLSGGDDDVDGEREDPETRAQPPADSPISHPRTSLPPFPNLPRVLITRLYLLVPVLLCLKSLLHRSPLQAQPRPSLLLTNSSVDMDRLVLRKPLEDLKSRSTLSTLKTLPHLNLPSMHSRRMPPRRRASSQVLPSALLLATTPLTIPQMTELLIITTDSLGSRVRKAKRVSDPLAATTLHSKPII